MESLAIAAALVIVYGAVSRRLDVTVVTPPMLFVAAGLLLGDGGLRILDLGLQEASVRTLAEATLVLALFIGLAAGEEGAADGASIIRFVGSQIGVGVAAGVAVGLIGGRVIDVTVRAGWMDGLFRQLSTFAVAVCAFATAEQFGGNGFIAAFAAGISFRQVARDQCTDAADFAEDEGQLLTLLTFLVFGAAVAGPALADAGQPQTLVYALLSLTVVRMLPVAVSLVGTRLTLPTVTFLGWFGPRGLASILFAVLIIEESDLAVQSDILTIVSWTVLLSIYAHGMSARPGAAAYARHVAPMASDRPEHQPRPGRVTGGG